jgi:hypothetical protein
MYFSCLECGSLLPHFPKQTSGLHIEIKKQPTLKVGCFG